MSYAIHLVMPVSIVACCLLPARAGAAPSSPVPPESSAQPAPSTTTSSSETLAAPSFAPADVFYGWVGIHSGAAWLDGKTAAQYRMGEGGATFYVSLGVGLFDLLTVSASFGAMFPSDHASFEQDVVPLFGDGPVTTAKSTLQVTNYAGEIGLRTPSFCLRAGSANNCLALHAFLNYGRAAFQAERFISSCRDCLTQDIPLRSASLLEPGVAFGIPSRDKFGIDLRSSYRAFLGDGGIAGEIRIGFALLFL